MIVFHETLFIENSGNTIYHAKLKNLSGIELIWWNYLLGQGNNRKNELVHKNSSTPIYRPFKAKGLNFSIDNV